MLPGVVYLEMARAAVEQAVGFRERSGVGIRLKNVVWARPITIGNHVKEVHVGLFPEDDRVFQYQIYTGAEHLQEATIVHSLGIAELKPLSEVPALDLPALQEQTIQRDLSMEFDYGLLYLWGLNMALDSRALRRYMLERVMYWRN